jgi:hypothetical protein
MVLALTLRPAPDAALAAEATPWWCVSCGQAGTADLFQNLLLLIPVGFCLGRGGWSFGRVALLALALPVAIELAQQWLIVGRDAALGDVLTNLSGCLIGYGLSARWPVVGAHGAPWRAATLGGLFVAQLIATASLVMPDPAGADPWRLREGSAAGGREPYRGVVLSTTRGGRAILHATDLKSQPDDPADQLDLGWRLTWDPGVGTRAAPIMRVEDARGWVVLALDHRGPLIGVEVRTGFAAPRLRTPTWGIAVPVGTAPGDTLTVGYRSTRGAVSLTVAGPAGTTSRRIPLGAQHGWLALNPFTPIQSSDAAWRAWTAAWLLGWGALLSWAARATRRPALLGVGAWLALLVVSRWSGAPAAPLDLLALLVGWALASLVLSRAEKARC